MSADRDYFAAMQKGIPPIGTPDPIADDEAEHGICAMAPIPSDLPTLSPDEIAEGDARQEHC